MPRFQLCIVKLLLATFIVAPLAHADPSSDAQKLADEATAILKANSQRRATPEQYATCILKLEQAQALLDKAGDTDSALAQEVTSSLFWARRFSDVNVIKALDKLRAGGASAIAAVPPVKVEPAKPAPPKEPAAADDPEAPPAPTAELSNAQKAFAEAEKFARDKSTDDYAVALRWFQMAAEHPGTDFAGKALELARAAQARFAGKSTTPPPEEKLDDTPEMQLIKTADKLAAAGKFDEAFPIYKESLKTKETLLAHRRLAQAYFAKGSQMRDVVAPKLLEAEKEVIKAWNDANEMRRLHSGRTYRRFNPRHAGYIAARKKWDALMLERAKFINMYINAESEFKAVLRMAPQKTDFDAAAHIGLCLCASNDMNARLRARQYLLSFLADYTPANDSERTLYEFCKAELDRTNKK
jgi:hypothetical protein